MCGIGIEIDDWQQRGPGNAGIRVCLHDASDRRGDIEIGSAGLFNDLGQFARAECAPPVERWRFRLRRCGVAGPQAVGSGNIEPGLRRIAGEQAATEGQCYTYTLQHHPKRAPPSFPSRLLSIPTPIHSKSSQIPAKATRSSSNITTVCRLRSFAAREANWRGLADPLA